MNWLGNLKLSVSALQRAGTGTLLSASSMAIGIMAVVLLFATTKGAEKEFENTLKQAGDNLLAVGAERIEANALRGGGRRFETLTLEDSIAIRDTIEIVIRVAPIAMTSVSLLYNGESMPTTAIGTTPDFQVTNNQILSAGRFIDDFDITNQRRVVVIGADIAKTLFYYEQPLGERLLVNGAPYIIVGVLQSKGLDSTGSPQDDRILLPITTAMRRLLNTDSVDRIFVQGRSKEVLPSTVSAVTRLLRDRHGLLQPSQKNDFTVRDQATLLRTLADTELWLGRMLIGVSVLALTMACIGLFAVALLSVKERQSEIGLRMAVGGLPIHILVQFLSEAVMISLLGAAVGLLLGSISIVVGENLLGWQMALSGKGILIPFAIAMVLSLLSGTYPALRAARIDPIVALRSD
jgi:putative ABC transport system permease protein